MYPELPAWHGLGELGVGVGTSGTNVRYGELAVNGRTDYIAVDPTSAGISAWLNGCNDLDKDSGKNAVTIAWLEGMSKSKLKWTAWVAFQHKAADTPNYCNAYADGFQEVHETLPDGVKYPEMLDFRLNEDQWLYVSYKGSGKNIGRAVIGKKKTRAMCFAAVDTGDKEMVKCSSWTFYPRIKCVW